MHYFGGYALHIRMRVLPFGVFRPRVPVAVLVDALDQNEGPTLRGISTPRGCALEATRGKDQNEGPTLRGISTD